MKIDILRNYNRFVGVVWVALWLNFLFQYNRMASFGEALLASLCIIMWAYPWATWLSTALLRKAMMRRKMTCFFLQFIGISCVITLGLLVCAQLFMYLEQNGTFEGSELFSELNSPTSEILNVLLVSLFINFGFCGLRFFEENLRLQKELADSQMEVLKNQINPHFMFNVLNHIHVLMQRDIELASSLLLQCSDVLRYQLYNGREEKVNLGQEMEFLQKYIEVEKLRWKGKLTVTACWEVADKGRLLSPLLMITFVENAFKHVSRSDTEKGYVEIKLMQKEEKLLLEVENSKSRLPQKSAQSLRLGLTNIRKRLNILYPDRYRLEIQETETKFKIKLVILIV